MSLFLSVHLSVCLSIAHHISGTIHRLIIVSGIYVLNDDMSRTFVHFFEILIFWVVRGVKGLKVAQNKKKKIMCHEPYLRNSLAYDHDF